MAELIDNGSASLRHHPGYRLGLTDDQVEPLVDSYVQGRGTRTNAAAVMPAGASPATVLRMARMRRLMATPGSVRERARALIDTDVRRDLARVSCPSLIIHSRAGLVPIEHGRYLAEHISEARLFEFDGDDLWCGDENSALMRECERFITSVSTDTHTERRLATILFTDIVGSTQTASAVGDTVWHRRLDSHDRISAVILERHDDTKVKSTGDGVLALFSSPSRAIDCALELAASLAEIGICIRAGIHTGRQRSGPGHRR